MIQVLESSCTTMMKSGQVRRPRVAILTNYPYDGKTFTGGVETATAGLFEGLQSYVEEFDFHIFTLCREISRHTVEARNGMTYHFLAIPNRWFTRPHVLPNILNARFELKKLQPDIVHCQDNMALAVASITSHQSRKVFTVHGIKSVESRVWEGPEYWSHQMDALLEKWIRKRFDEVIAISPYVDRFLPAGVKKHHITNPVRTKFFESPQSGVQLQRMLFVGALTRLKRPLDAIKAHEIVIRDFPDATLSLVGETQDKEYEREIRRYIRDAHITGVEFLGVRTQEDVAALMRESAMLVLTSVQENTPMVVAESMASGLPVIASKVGGIPDMINNGTDGLLFECGDVHSLARLMTDVLRSGDLRNSLSRNGRAKALATYSSEAVAAATVSVYRTMMRE
ncbi:MAG: glycosyltransferase family 4 protein [Bacteroidetes bacterium]|nr:glycosyltransferase family 4 protein [Bacteroidota bacterium]MCW5895374.1 glycosyltransferase family 4 protein [Bacteroidota bacterium]